MKKLSTVNPRYVGVLSSFVSGSSRSAPSGRRSFGLSPRSGNVQRLCREAGADSGRGGGGRSVGASTGCPCCSLRSFGGPTSRLSAMSVAKTGNCENKLVRSRPRRAARVVGGSAQSCPVSDTLSRSKRALHRGRRRGGRRGELSLLKSPCTMRGGGRAA